ncbi:MAG: stage II sporulation protein P, partial [Oliverpabstia sp.]
QEETGEIGNSQLPAWTTAVEMAPSVDLSQESLGNFDYVLNHFFVVDPNTTIDSSQLNAAALLDDDLALEADGENPQILIYHTHSQEGYIDSVPGDENTTVIGVGNYLESLLRDIFGYQVIHMKDAFDMANGTLERSKAYNYALPAVEKVLEENPSVQVVIDLHRDGVPDDRHLVTEINGKPTAQIMYFNGLSRTVSNGSLDSLPNPYIEDNLAFSFQMSVQAARYYPELTRCIYLKGYRYNLHVRPRSMLLEVGAQTNTVEEAMNAMEPFSVILNKVLRGE